MAVGEEAEQIRKAKLAEIAARLFVLGVKETPWPTNRPLRAERLVCRRTPSEGDPSPRSVGPHPRSALPPEAFSKFAVRRLPREG